MEWISVKDRLPETNGNYIVYANDMNVNDSEFIIWGREVITEADFYGGEWSWYEGEDEYDITDLVTHWMPMPEPPKEK